MYTLDVNATGTILDKGNSGLRAEPEVPVLVPLLSFTVNSYPPFPFLPSRIHSRYFQHQHTNITSHTHFDPLRGYFE